MDITEYRYGWRTRRVSIRPSADTQGSDDEQSDPNQNEERDKAKLHDWDNQLQKLLSERKDVKGSKVGNLKVHMR